MGKRNVKRLLQEALIPGEKFDLLSGEVLKWLPQVDDTGSFNIGDGTNDMDFKIFLGATTTYVDFNKGNAQMQMRSVDIDSNSNIVTTGGINCAALNTTGTITPSGSSFVALKTASVNSATIVVNSTRYGSLLATTKADGATTVQLPTPAAGTDGAWLHVEQQANQNLVINCTTANKIVSLNSVTYNTVTFSTANEKIGAHVVCVADATKWHVAVIQGTATLA